MQPECKLYVRYRVTYAKDDTSRGTKTVKTLTEANKFYNERMKKTKLNEKSNLWPRIDEMVTMTVKDGTPK